MRHLRYFTLLLLPLFAQWGSGQQILVDRGLQAAGLWCFPLLEDSLTYLYLPSTAELATEHDSLPQFSYLRYVVNKPSGGDGTRAVTEAGGGGILTFLVLYRTPEEQVAGAQKALRGRLDNKNIKLRGPVVFEKGRYALVSSVLAGDSTTRETRLLTTGEAPVLEGSRLAFTFELNPEASKILLESFRMATPDVSLIFELGFSGLSDTYDATMDVDWAEVQQSKAFSAGASMFFVSADVNVGFEKLRRDGAIKLTTSGSNEQMEHLVQTVYDKLLTLMFTPVKPETVPEQSKGGILSALGSLFGLKGTPNSRNLLGFGANVAYQLKDLRTEGKSHLTFKGRSARTLNHFITFNIGDLYQRYGSDRRYFRDVPLWDPAFQQRELFLGVDAEIEKEFNKLINSVTVIVEKKHGNGESTLQSLIVRRGTFANGQVNLSTVYGNRGDTDRTQWLTYRYRTIWQFQGGGTLQTGWDTSAAAMINLYTPFTRRTITVDGDMARLQAAGVRAVAVEVDYPFFGITKHHQLTIRLPAAKSENTFEITLPNDAPEIDYSITWFSGNGGTKSAKGKDKYGAIFVDEMP